MPEPRLLDTLADLVRINSVSPSYPGGRAEKFIAAYIREFFTKQGIENFEQEVFPDRPNVVARLPGRDPKRRIVFEAHMDTVAVNGMSIPPFEPTVADGKLFGRGSCDDKGGLCAMMVALASVKRAGVTPPCEIQLCAAADEEYSYRGVVRFCQGLTGQAAVVAEPTEMRVVIAGKGVLRWKVAIHGKAAHSSKPHLGVNAISHAARVVLAFEREHEMLKAREHPLLGPGTLNVGLISGGVQVNFVPDECVLEIDRRLLPGEKPDDVLAGYERMLDELRAQHPTLQVEQLPPRTRDEGLGTAPDAAPVRLASEILGELKLNPEPGGVPFGSDASKLSRQGLPSILIGPGSIDRAHAAVEYVEVEQVEAAFEFYRQFMLRFE
ncbi:MAG: ArgE/DapE family deacylase [Verrucomicrobia bacterium]|nr:ArgE/DapE family deacylase [Verrucomicrobiota bacterium]